MAKDSRVVLFALIKRGKILLEIRPISGFAKPQYLIPGGAINEGLENLEEALKREMMEELGVTPIDFKLLIEQDLPGINDNILKPFVVNRWHGDIPKLILDKEDPHSLEWVNIDRSIDLLPTKATKEIIEILKNYLLASRRSGSKL